MTSELTTPHHIGMKSDSKVTVRPWCLVLLIAMSSAIALPSAAQVVLQVDQRSGTVRIDSSSDPQLISIIDGHSFRLRRPGDVKIRVVNTNTALYTITTDEASAAPASFEPLRQFLTPIKAYMPELAVVVQSGNRSRGGAARSMLPAVAPRGATNAASEAARDALTNAKAVEGDLVRIDNARLGLDGVYARLELALYTLELMKKEKVETAADEFADSLRIRPRSCAKDTGTTAAGSGDDAATSTPAELLQSYRELRSHTMPFETSLRDTSLVGDPQLNSLRAQLVQTRQRADSALANAQATIADAYRAEELTNVVLHACSHWDSRPIKVSSAGGRVITLHIAPRAEPELARVAERRNDSQTITILPPMSRLGATFGLSALYAAAARFHTYGVRATGGAGSPNEVYEATSVDDRFLYGLSLGLSYNLRPDWHDHARPVFWLPVITVAEAGNQRAIGLGAAVSVWRFKLGAGALAVRHQELDGLSVHQQVTNATYLTTRDTYGHPIFYVAFSIINLEQLLGGGDTKAQK